MVLQSEYPLLSIEMIVLGGFAIHTRTHVVSSLFLTGEGPDGAALPKASSRQELA